MRIAKILTVALLAIASGTTRTAMAQDPAVFVTFMTSTGASGTTPTAAGTTAINPPGTGWNYSAAAQVTGTTWNQILRPNPQILGGSANGGTLGTFVCNSANNIALTGGTGGATTNIHLTIAITIGQIDSSNTTRVEPNNIAGGATAQGPGGLMGQGWRITANGNYATMTLTGLTPGAQFLLYFYGSSTTSGQGGVFALDTAYRGDPSTASVTTSGGNSGNIFAFDGTTYSLTAAGTTWQVIHAKTDATGKIVFTTAKNTSGYQIISGFQIIPYPAPAITGQPAGATALTGNSASLSVIASSFVTPAFQWQKSTDGGANFTNIDSAANPSAATAALSLTNLQLSDAGSYRVIVTNPGGSVTSSPAALTVNQNPSPSFSLQPFSQTILNGGAVTFYATASAPSGVSYQWFKNGVAITGATGSSYTIPAATAADSGSYTVQVTNAYGTLSSNAATLSIVDALPLPAFPGAEGPGSSASGGRSGDVYHVTTLNDDRTNPPSGSLRYGLSNAPSGGRTIVFDVGGTIRLSSTNAGDAGSLIWLRSGANNLTIAGQTAPYPGITIIGQGTKLTGSNMVVRNMAFRPGPDKKSPGISTNDGLSLQTKNSIIDHVSVGFNDDEGLSPTDAVTNTTVQYSIIAEGLNYVLADNTAHAMGTLLASEVADAPLSMHHNLFSDMRTRNPRVGNDGNGVVLGGTNEGSINNISNNVVYNWDGRACYDVAGKPARANFINNYFIGGPDTGSTDPVFFGTGTNTRIYSTGNMVDMNKNVALDGRAFSFASGDPQFSGSIATVPTPFAVEPGYVQPATNAYDSVLNYAGTFWWNRTQIEARIINEVRTGGGKVIKSGTEIAVIAGYEYPATTGGALYQEPSGGAQIAIFDGLPLFPMVSRPAGFDTDGDGMPDAWEIPHGLDPNVADNNGDYDGDGYTNLEEYLNEVAAFPAPKTLTFNLSGGRYARCSNWDLNWQPSRYDTVRITSGTAIVDAPDQHAGTLVIGGDAGLPVELQINSGWLQVANSVTVGGNGGTGKLSINGGQLLTGTGGMLVETGGTLAGSGTLAGPATINGIHSPGQSAGSQAFSGALTYGAASRLRWELTQNTVSGLGTSYDAVSAGSVTVTSGAVIDVALNSFGSAVDFRDAFWFQNRVWNIVSATSVTGTFSLGSVSPDAGGRSTASFGTFSIQPAANGISLKWTSKYQTWQEAQFGADATNPAIAAPGADPDGDGASNENEFWAGTGPLDPGDRLEARELTASASSFEMKTTGRVGRIYALERTVELTSGVWIEIMRTAQVLADSEITLTDPASPPSRAFYRIRVIAP